MLLVLQIVTATLVSIAMALALAHALELPGKLRLTEQTYRAVQTIYYPGFFLGGLAEPLGLISLLRTRLPHAQEQRCVLAHARVIRRAGGDAWRLLAADPPGQ